MIVGNDVVNDFETEAGNGLHALAVTIDEPNAVGLFEAAFGRSAKSGDQADQQASGEPSIPGAPRFPFCIPQKIRNVSRFWL